MYVCLGSCGWLFRVYFSVLFNSVVCIVVFVSLLDCWFVGVVFVGFLFGGWRLLRFVLVVFVVFCLFVCCSPWVAFAYCICLCFGYLVFGWQSWLLLLFWLFLACCWWFAGLTDYLSWFVIWFFGLYVNGYLCGFGLLVLDFFVLYAYFVYCGFGLIRFLIV